ncbi:MAG: hypothetical protein QW172_06425 [Candidatus Bathyarchaeia archaeon]
MVYLHLHTRFTRRILPVAYQAVFKRSQVAFMLKTKLPMKSSAVKLYMKRWI